MSAPESAVFMLRKHKENLRDEREESKKPMTLTEWLLAEKLYEAERAQINRNYAHGHSFLEWLTHALDNPLRRTARPDRFREIRGLHIPVVTNPWPNERD